MPSSLLLTIRFHDGRYHGAGDWPPSPARLFQALVAAAARGKALPEEASAALSWLETLEAPVIAAPAARLTKAFVNWVPNNDLDAVGGDVRRIGEIRAGKAIRAHIFDANTPLIYCWRFEATEETTPLADRICAIALGLYQLGRGVDMAWAVGECVSPDEAAERLSEHGGSIHRPGENGRGNSFECPASGSLESLARRHAASEQRFKTLTAPAPTKKEPNKTKAAGQLFTQPPKPWFRQVAYDCPPIHLLFDLSPQGAAWPFVRVPALVERLRDGAAEELTRALPDKKALVERIFIGSKDSSDADKAARIRIAPLPSIGHQHADHVIRRVLISIPSDCPLSVGDIEWGFSGLELSDIDEATGEVLNDRSLVRATDERMLGHYGAVDEKHSRRWRTVTPAALPERAERRRIDPMRVKEEAKNGAERRCEIECASSAVVSSLRHAGIEQTVQSIRVQREPFEARGARAEDFAAGTRFSKHRLWHAEIEFQKPVPGPLIIGDGRYLGLGLMAPIKEEPRDAFVFSIEAKPPIAADQRLAFLRAVRRALMALDRDHGGDGVSRLFSGHEDDGSPARSGTHDHVFLAVTTANDRLSQLHVLSPTLADRKSKLNSSVQRSFYEIVRKLEIVRAGKLGVVNLVELRSNPYNSGLVKLARIWESETPYIPTRHWKSKTDQRAWLIEDVVRECARRGLPRPGVELLSFVPSTKLKPRANLRLTFGVPINGPILLGQEAHFGSGLFRSSDL